MNKNWYKSKAKWAAILLAGSAILGAGAAYLNGQMDLGTLLNTIMVAGGGLGIWGVRDALK